MVTSKNVDDITSYGYNTLIFYVNGHRVEETRVDPKTTLAVYLRDHCRHYSANSCLMPVCAVFGKAVTTVEGLGSTVSKKLHP
ncbi:hypothetical protein OSTOST_10652, partial [Ostertagia ostertagi]